MAYKYVRIQKKRHGQDFNKYCAVIKVDGKPWHSPYKNTEREAAIAADIKLIELGREPVNILTKKNQ